MVGYASVRTMNQSWRSHTVTGFECGPVVQAEQ